MNNKIKLLIDKLGKNRSLITEEYEQIVLGFNAETAEYAAKKAVEVRKKIYSNKVFIRGLIEISNICKNNCYYCGIRGSNKNCNRYRLTYEEILDCCKTGYEMDFRTFVLQGGEDNFFSDEKLIPIIKKIKELYPDTAVTLSLGERTKESYEALKKAGADRYLLRHETADKEHYMKLHPQDMSFDNRMECLKNLKELGYQVGCGFMVGSPFQTPKTLAKDLKFIETFEPHMCGIGPFITHHDTPFKDMPSGDFKLTLYLLSIVRLINPTILLPATTALGTINPKGREMGILAGANVIMPNLSPQNVREKYSLYDGKIFSGNEAAESINKLKESINFIGYEIVTSRGDNIKFTNERINL